MAGIFDLHALQALAAAWPAYRDTVAEFTALFGGVTPAVLAAWHAEFVEHPPAFRLEAGIGSDRFPLVTARLDSETPGERYLASSAGRDDDGTPLLAFNVEQTVVVTVYARNAEIARALAVMTRASMLRAHNEFLAIGYHDLAYGGAQPLEPREQLVSEEHGQFARSQRWTATSEVLVRGAVYTGPAGGHAWSVQLDGAVVDPAWGVVDGELPNGVPIPGPAAGDGSVTPDEDG